MLILRNAYVEKLCMTIVFIPISQVVSINFFMFLHPKGQKNLSDLLFTVHNDEVQKIIFRDSNYFASKVCCLRFFNCCAATMILLFTADSTRL